MNVVIACGKDNKKSIKDFIENKKEDIRVLGVETVITKDFVDRLINYYNPHVFLFIRGTKFEKDYDEISLLREIKTFKSSIRIVYIYGFVINEKSYDDILLTLKNIGVEAVLRDKIKQSEVQEAILGKENNQEISKVDTRVHFEEEPATVSESEIGKMAFAASLPCPNKSDFVSEELENIKNNDEKGSALLEKFLSEQKVDTRVHSEPELPKQEFPEPELPKQEEKQQDYSFTKSDDFDFFVVEKEVEYEKEVTSIVGNIVVGVGQLLNRCGCTFTAVELAWTLQNNGFDVAVVIKNSDTYNKLAAYYMQDGTNGFKLSNINFYNEKHLSVAKGQHKIVVYDLGLLNNDNYFEFEASQIKLLLCDASEWNLSVIEEFLEQNKSKPYIKNIKYCFNFVGKKRFSELFKTLMRQDIVSYRLTLSEDSFTPNTENYKQYREMMKSILESQKTEKKSIFKR